MNGFLQLRRRALVTATGRVTSAFGYGVPFYLRIALQAAGALLMLSRRATKERLRTSLEPVGVSFNAYLRDRGRA